MSKQESLPYSVPLMVRDACLCLHLQQAARALARRFDEALRPLGLTSGQYSLLMSLHRKVPPGMAEVAHVLAMDRTTLTAALKPLQRRGLVDIRVDPKDRRSRRLILTPEGLDVLSRAFPVWRRTNDALETLLPADSSADIRAGLRALAHPDGDRNIVAA